MKKVSTQAFQANTPVMPRTPKKATSKKGLSGESEIRRHYYLDRYVIIAPKRNLRPDSFAGSTAEHATETAASPAIEKDPAVYEIKDPKGGWLVRVVDNLYPAVSIDNPKAYGKQEIVIETPEHNVEFSQLSISQIEHVFTAFSQRIAALWRIKGVKYVAVFKNDGPKAGASIAHAHSQLIALPIVPPLVQEEADAIDAYLAEHETCPHCDVISWEQQQKTRMIYEDKNVVAFAPYAASYPFAVWILPKRHAGQFADLNLSERHSIAVILKKITAFLDSAKISFNFFLHDSLPGYQHHFYIKVEPRATTWAGLELSTGIVINPVSPEYAASWYRREQV